MTDSKINSTDLYKELHNFLCGKSLGSGISRDTYIYRPDPTKVIKVETNSCSFQNIREFNTWEDLQYLKGAKEWLAPVHWISDNGIFLIMDRVTPIPKHMLPKQIPAFLTDTSVQNFGLLNGKVVACDYGYVRTTHKLHMVKADWYDCGD